MAKGKKKKKSARSADASEHAEHEDAARDAEAEESETPDEPKEASAPVAEGEEGGGETEKRDAGASSPAPADLHDPYAGEPDGGKGALVFLAIVAVLLALAVAIGFIQEM